MKTKRILKICYPVLTGGWMGFILSNSMRSAEAASLRTGFVFRILEEIFHWFVEPDRELPGFFLTAIPKIGHFIEYFLFSVFFTLTFLVLRNSLKRDRYVIYFYGFAFASFDGFVQRFFEGRGSSVLDVWIDFSGVFVAFWTVYLLHKIMVRRRNVQ